MIVMPANSSGWFWHALARETGRLGLVVWSQVAKARPLWAIVPDVPGNAARHRAKPVVLTQYEREEAQWESRESSKWKV